MPACAVVLLALLPAVRAQDPPKVVALSPAQFDCQVDAAATTALTVTFDQPMDTRGCSFCGGGPEFPDIEGRPVWRDDRTVTVAVTLAPDRDYRLSLNSPSSSNFRSRQGARLAPLPWSFATLPAVLPDQDQQRQRDRRAFQRLVETLDASYSHRDLRVRDWDRLYAAGGPAALAAKTDKAFAAAVAAMLQPTADIHLCVQHGDRLFPTGTRAVDPLWRRQLLDRYLQLQPAGKEALAGRTDDGIGYLLVGSWSAQLDLRAIEQALASLRDCRAMVVDARPNSGGDERLAMQVAAWFVDGTRTYAQHRYRTRPGKDGFGPVLDRTIAGNPAEKRCRGPIAVLTSPCVMSSSESFVLMLRQARDCTVVGQPTYGSSGNPKPFDLGNGVTAMVPTWQDLRPDGTCFEGEGLRPDVLVECPVEVLQLRDPILERALQLLRQKLAR